MAYKDGDENKYFPMMLAAVIAIAIAVAGFIYTVVKAEPKDLEDKLLKVEGIEVVESEEGSLMVDPAGSVGPSGPPMVPAPTSPPPGS